MTMSRTLMKAIGKTHLRLYRLTRGMIGASLAGKPMLLLTSTGRKTGTPRTTPLQYLKDGENLVIVASNGGNPSNPAWWFNLDAAPEAEAQIGKQKRRVRAETVLGEERERLWALLVDVYPEYDGYQKETERTIPVVMLQPRV